MIEFVGLPGAGKSTIASHLAAHLERRGIPCRNSPASATLARRPVPGRRGRLQRAVQDLMLSAGLSWKCRRALLWIARRPDAHRRLPRYWRLMRTWLAAERLRGCDHLSRQRCVWIFDQGLLQCLYSIYPAKVTLEEQRTLTRWAVEAMREVLPDLVVLVTLNEEVAVQRMKARSPQRNIPDLLGPEIEDQLRPRGPFVEDSLPRALAGSSVRLVTVSGLDLPQQNAERITQAVVRLLSDSANPGQVHA